MDSTGYITLSLFSHKILVSDFPTQNSYFVFLMKTISFILPYFECGLRGIFFESDFRFDERGTENGDPAFEGPTKKGKATRKVRNSFFLVLKRIPKSWFAWTSLEVRQLVRHRICARGAH